MGAPALAAMGAVAAATGKGLYVSPDSVFYVGTARNLLDHRGLTPPSGLPPIGHFPPLFTFTLVAVGKLGLDPVDAARVINVVALGAVVVVVGLLVRWATGSVPAALAASTLAAAAVDLLTYSAAALSEPLFVLLAVCALGAMAVHLDRDRSLATLAPAAGFAAAACLTRYVGVALVVAGIVALLRFGAGRRGHGALDALVFAALALVPSIGFLAWAGGADRGGGDRSLAWHGFGPDYLGQAVRPLARWVVPVATPPVGPLLAVVAIAAAVTLLRRPRTVATPRGPSAPALPWLLGAFGVAYLAAVVGNRLVTDATGRLDARFLAPLHVVAILLAVPWLYRRQDRAVLLLGGALVVGQVAAAGVWAGQGLTDEGIPRRGYNATAWRASPVMALVAANDARLPLYSNAFDAIAFLTREPSTPVPAKRQYLTGRPNPGYAEQLETMRHELASSGGYLAYFDAATYRRSFLPSRAELEQALPLEVVLRDSVGTLYRVRPPNR